MAANAHVAILGDLVQPLFEMFEALCDLQGFALSERNPDEL